MAGRWLVLAVLLWATGVAAEPPPPAGLAEAVRLGGPMVIAPLCELRDGRWGNDLRSALSGRAAGTPGEVAGALGYAEAEALEDFAGGPAAACTELAGSAGLAEADRIVRAWREGRPAS